MANVNSVRASTNNMSKATHPTSTSYVNRTPPTKHNRQPTLHEIFEEIKKKAIEVVQLQTKETMETRIKTPEVRVSTCGERPGAPEKGPKRR